MAEEVKREVNQKEESDKAKQQQSSQQSKNDSTNSMNLALFGGLIGAGIGLLINPEKAKKAFCNFGESDFAKTAGKELRKTAQTLLAVQAQNSLNQLAATDREGSIETSSPDYEELEKENKKLNERLEKIEQMLDELVETK